MQTNHRKKLLCHVQWAWGSIAFWGTACNICKESKCSGWRQSVSSANSTKKLSTHLMAFSNKVHCIVKILDNVSRIFWAVRNFQFIKQWSYKLILFSDGCLVSKCYRVEYFMLLVSIKFCGFELINSKLSPLFFLSDFKVSLFILT